MPRKYTEDDKRSILRKFVTYINSKDRPIMREFCIKNDLSATIMQKWSKFNDVEIEGKGSNIHSFTSEIEKSKMKLTLYYQLQAETARNSFYIFALKCVGKWRELSPEEQATQGTKVTVNTYKNLSNSEIETGIQNRLKHLKEVNQSKNKSN